MNISVAFFKNLAIFRLHSLKIWKSPAVLSFYIAVILVLAVLLSSTMFLRSQEGLAKGLSIIQSQDQIKKSLQSVDVSSSTSDQQPTKSSSDIQTKAALEQAKEISKIISPDPIPLSAWLLTLQNHRIVKSPMVVFMSPLELSPRQKLIAQVQGIKFVSWDQNNPPPKRQNKITSINQVWVGRPDLKNRVWVVHGGMGDLLEEIRFEGETLTNLDVIKMILWADELQKQDEWLKNHPSPTPPEDVRPSFVSVSLIPSDVALQVAFWISIGFISLFVSSCALLSGLSVWSTMQKEGALNAFSFLPIPIWVLIVYFTVEWVFKLLIVILLSSVVSMLILFFFDLPFHVLDYIKFAVLTLTGSYCAFCLAVLAQVFHPSPAWRLWVTIVLGLVVASLELLYLVFFSNAKIIALMMTSFGFVVFGIIGVLVAMSFVYLASVRIEKFNRLAMRKF